MKDPFSSFVREAVKDAAEEVSYKARCNIVDAIYCEMHNHGYTLEGNTAETDVRWFARNLYQALKVGTVNWDMETEETRMDWDRQARVVLTLLPNLMSRMSHRCIAYSRTLKTILEAEKATEKAKA